MRVILALVCAVALIAISMAVNTDAKLVQPIIDASLLSSDSTSSVDAEALSQVRSFAESVQSTTVSTCPGEALRRISLCQKIIRNFVTTSDAKGEKFFIPFVPSWSSSAICKTLNQRFPSTVNYDNCQSTAGHLFGAAGSKASNFAILSRENDMHDVCVKLLSTEFPAASGQRFITTQDAATCGLKATGGVTGVRCLILHGMGIERVIYRDNPNVNGQYSRPFDGWFGRYGSYFNVEIPFDGICDARFYITDTTHRGWNDKNLQQEYCDAIAKYEPHFVFTHSMANMLLAAGIHDGVSGCKRISKQASASTTMWFSSQAPWVGSPVATAFWDTCKKPTKGLWEKIKAVAINMYQRCGSEPAADSIYPGFVNPFSNMQLSLMKETARKYVSGALCGLSGSADNLNRAFTEAGVGLWFLSKLGDGLKLVDWGSDAKFSFSFPFSGNDGLVPWASCNLGVTYAATPSAEFYAARVNHEDGPCSHPDDPSNGANRQPCTWFVNRAMQARTAFGLGTARSINVLAVARDEYIPFSSFHYPRSFLELEDYHTLEERNALDKAAEEKAAAEKAKKESIKGRYKARRSQQMKSAAASEESSDSSHLESQSSVAAEMSQEAEIAAEAEAQLVEQGLIDAATDAEFEADAEAEADVAMELAHQQHIDQATQDQAEELEIQLEAATQDE